jgi:hypothetical protein
MKQRAPFRKLSQNIRDLALLAERSLAQPHDIIQGLFNRTLEVWGSIPHGSTRKRNRRAEMRGVFVFGVLVGYFGIARRE